MDAEIRSRCAFLVAGLIVLGSAEWAHSQSATREAMRGDELRAQERGPGSHELYESGRIQFSAPPPTLVQTGVQCDANGNIYVLYGASFEATYIARRRGVSLPVSKISLDSKRVVQFPVGELQGYAEYQRRSYYVDPNGKFYGLVLAYLPNESYKGPRWADSLVVKYKDDGTVDSVVKVGAASGKHFQGWRLAVFLDGSFLITGAEMSEENRPARPFTAIFDAAGTVVAPLKLSHDAHPPRDNPAESGHKSERENRASEDEALSTNQRNGGQDAVQWMLDVQQGLMAGSLNGNVYLLRASSPAQLYAISSAGSIVRSLEIKPPEPGMRPIQMSLAGQNSLLIELSTGPSRGHPETHETLAVVDPGTGRIVDIYHLPSKANQIPACASSRNEFLFLNTSKDSHLEVVKYAAR